MQAIVNQAPEAQWYFEKVHPKAKAIIIVGQNSRLRFILISKAR